MPDRTWNGQVQLAFIHRFCSRLNEHAYFPVCVVDGIFEEVPVGHWTSRKRVFVVVGFRCIAEIRFAPLLPLILG